MSTRTRKKRVGPASHAAVTGTQAVGGYQQVPMPVWRWRTVPVYMAFAVGGFVGTWGGVFAMDNYNETSDSTYLTIVYVFWALLLGFGLSRLVSRWMLSRGWSRARAANRK